MVTTRPPKTIVKPTALGPVANTDTKLLIYGLFQKGRVLAQDGIADHVVLGNAPRARIRGEVRNRKSYTPLFELASAPGAGSPTIFLSDARSPAQMCSGSMLSKEPKSKSENCNHWSILLCAAAYSMTPKLVGLAVEYKNEVLPTRSLSHLYSLSNPFRHSAFKSVSILIP